MSFAATLHYHSAVPPSCPECRVGLELLLLSGPTLMEGEVAEVLITVGPAQLPVGESRPTGMTVAVVGLPGGLEPRYDRLAEVNSKAGVYFYICF